MHSMSPRITAAECERLRTAVWLGRQDSNLGMAESKSARFLNTYSTCSENTANFAANGINRLVCGSERESSTILAAQRGWAVDG
jgi:hypothetical protein